jgi:hypothetical protein
MTKLGIDYFLKSVYNLFTKFVEKPIDKLNICVIEYKNRTNVLNLSLKGDDRMSDNERELLNIIRTHDDPERALDIAIELLIGFLDGREAPQCTSLAHPRATA